MSGSEQAANMLDVRNLKKHFPVTRGLIFAKTIGTVKAVDGVSFTVAKGETLGLVGESGCGKSTLGRLITRLLEADSGSILYGTRDVTRIPAAEMRALRRKIQIIFQDPYSSLNPRMKVGDIVSEPLKLFGLASGKQKKTRLDEIFTSVGLDPGLAGRFPHEFSGGQRQRIGIARSLALNPEIIICDEPVSALDVSIQAQIINLLQDLQQQFKLTYLFISHDLSVVKHVSTRIAVMYLGKIVEMAENEALYRNPLHPYTEALLSAVPIPDTRVRRKRVLLQGDVPSPIEPPGGCRFHPRCRYVMDVCRLEEPRFLGLGPGRFCACHLRTGPGGTG
jgi:oligopeptide transport system ATP-binding protein